MNQSIAMSARVPQRRCRAQLPALTAAIVCAVLAIWPTSVSAQLLFPAAITQPAESSNVDAPVIATQPLIFALPALPLEAAAAVEATTSALVDDGPTLDEAGLPPQCDLWYIDTRPCCCCTCEFMPCVMHYVCGEGWVSSTLEAFYATDDPQVVTSIMVHGNDNDVKSAIDQGSKIYRHICCGCPSDQKLRYVIWAWPSDYIFGCYRHDVRMKAMRVDPQAFCLARFLAGLRPDLPVSLIGYSYGAPIVMGSLHLLAGGCLCGRELGIENTADRRRFHVVLMAAAMPNTALCCGCKYGLAMMLVERLAIMINPKDRILKHFQMLARDRRGPDALGLTGPVCCKMVDGAWNRIVYYNVFCCVRRHHFLKHYIASCCAMGIVRKEALLMVPLEAPPVAEPAKDQPPALPKAA